MRQVVTLTILAGLAAGLPAQESRGTIVGRVVDSMGTPLPGVSITICGRELPSCTAAKTDSAGRYRFATLAPGDYALFFDLAPYTPALREKVAVEPGKPLTLDVPLTPSPDRPVQLEQNHVIGAPKPLPRVRIETSFGEIDILVDEKRAPVTAANFLKYVDGGFYEGGRFHRATRQDNYTPAPPNRPAMAIIQGGINPARKGEGFPPIPLERTSVTGLKHVAGVVSMARGGPDSATSDFFVLLDDQPSLDFGGRRFDDGQGGAAFGWVVKGLDTVFKIQQQPVEAQRLSPPVPIVRAARVR